MALLQSDCTFTISAPWVPHLWNKDLGQILPSLATLLTHVFLRPWFSRHNSCLTLHSKAIIFTLIVHPWRISCGLGHFTIHAQRFLFFFKYLFIYYVSNILSVYMPAGQKRAPDLITDGCEPPCGCWELNSGPLEEQAMLLTTEPSLQPSTFSLSANSWGHFEQSSDERGRAPLSKVQ